MSSLLSAIQSRNEPENEPFKTLNQYSKPIRPFLSRLAGNIVVSAEQARQINRKLIDRLAFIAKEHEAKFILVLTPPSREYRKRSSDYLWFQETLATLPYPYLDFFQYANEHKLNPKTLYFDRSHYSAKGGKLFAKAIVESMKVKA